VFGQISASVGEREIALEGQHRRVLAALAIMGPKRVRAERLYNALFPDLPDEQANRLLITTISALRHRLRKAAGLSKTHDPDPILRDSTGYGLNPALVRVDSYAFQELLARSHAAPPEEQGDLLAEAVDLYRGDLCGDQEMEWLIDVIPAWRRQYLEAVAALATYYADIAGDLAQAERTARRLVDEEPTVMPYTHLLMRVRAARNDEPGVQKAYHEHRQALIALEMDDEADGTLAGLDEESLWDTEQLCERLCHEIRDRRMQGESVSKAG
jgi:DNA-binding SARP family transcriptional activator